MKKIEKMNLKPLNSNEIKNINGGGIIKRIGRFLGSILCACHEETHYDSAQEEFVFNSHGLKY